MTDIPSHAQEQSSSAAGCDERDNVPLDSEQSLGNDDSPQNEDIIGALDLPLHLRHASRDSNPTSSSCSLSPPIPVPEPTYEPLTTFRPKVHALLLTLFPTLLSSDLDITPFKDGAHNRIIGISILEPLRDLSFISPKPIRKLLEQCIYPRRRNRRAIDRFILRIPRSPDHAPTMPYEITTLAYLRRSFPTLTPQVIYHDTTRDNPLGRPYTLRKWLPGVSLAELWPKLNLQQKKSFAAWLGGFMGEMHGRQSACAGVVSPEQLVANLARPKTEKWPVPRAFVEMLDTGLGRAKSGEAARQTTREWMVDMCERQRKWAEGVQGQPVYPHVWDGFLRMIDRLHGLGFLPDEEVFHFWQGEFDPRNFLVGIADDSSVCVHGILDWDLAGFVPEFVSTQTPFWLWTGERAGAEIKGAYEAAVNYRLGDWTAPEYALLRRMYRILTRGVLAGEDEREAKVILQEFEKLHPRMS